MDEKEVPKPGTRLSEAESLLFDAQYVLVKLFDMPKDWEYAGEVALAAKNIYEYIVKYYGEKKNVG